MEKQFRKTVIINRAVPGSGKTTLSCNITDACKKAGLSVANHSTDDFFMEDNRYCFKAAKLHNYHLCNLMLFERSLRNNIDVVICDNTNIMPWQSRPYIDLARAYGYQIIFFNLSPRELEKHVAAAWKEHKNDEILPDEDLPVKKQNRWLSILCLIFAYLAMAMLWVFFAAILLIDLFKKAML